MQDRPLLNEQVAYYRARAQEYDEWFFRKGRYDLGPEHTAQWFREVEQIETALQSSVGNADVLELACGTGLWTRHLAENNPRIVAVDASPETIAINRERVCSPKVEYLVADLFSWTPPAAFDVVFFSFWLSHVPPTRFEGFWTLVRAALRPGGRVFFIDGLGPVDESGISRRRLNDGREFDIVKVFYDPPVLERRLLEQGWQGWVRSTENFFLYGSMAPVPQLRYYEGPPGSPLLRTVNDVSLLLENCFSAGVSAALLYAENLTPNFLDLSSGEAGAILQKLRIYRVRLAVIRPPGSPPLSLRFTELAAEESRSHHFGLFDSRSEAVQWLRKHQQLL